MNSIFCSYEEQICIKLAKTHKEGEFMVNGVFKTIHIYT